VFKLITIALCLVSVGCLKHSEGQFGKRPDKLKAEEHSWPSSIDLDKIDIRHTEFSNEAPFDQRDPNLISKEYLNFDKKVLNSIGIVTKIYYLSDENVFYVICDCLQGHGDGIQGPFQGDPRIVLKVGD
jgi:hypothetical protein